MILGGMPPASRNPPVDFIFKIRLQHSLARLRTKMRMASTQTGSDSSMDASLTTAEGSDVFILSSMATLTVRFFISQRNWKIEYMPGPAIMLSQLTTLYFFSM